MFLKFLLKFLYIWRCNVPLCTNNNKNSGYQLRPITTPCLERVRNLSFVQTPCSAGFRQHLTPWYEFLGKINVSDLGLASLLQVTFDHPTTMSDWCIMAQSTQKYEKIKGWSRTVQGSEESLFMKASRDLRMGGGGSGCSFWYSQVSWWGSSSEFSLPQTKITRSWNITTDLSWVFTKWSTHNTVPPVTPNLPLGRFVSCPQAASKSHVVKRYSLSILSPCTLVLSLRVMESRTKLTYQLGTILQVARSWDPMSCHWYKITSIWRDIEGLCVIFGNWGCLQLPSLLPPWPQNSRVLAVVFPWLSLACVHTVQRNEKLSEHLAYREVVSACMKKLISIEKKERVLAIYSPVFCLVMLSICSSCSAIIVCLCFIVVFFWLLSWIAFSLILALLGGIWWAQIGLLLSASVSTWRSGSISLTMEFCGVWGCVCNFTWMGTLWLTHDCVIVHKLGYWK